MSSLYEDVPPPSSMKQAWAGFVATDAKDFSDDVMVTIPDLDPNLRVGPCTWQPRNSADLPSRGDECLVIFDTDNRPWISVWWPQAGGTTVIGGENYILFTRNTSQALTANAWTTIPMTAVDTDIGDPNKFELSGGNMVCLETGVYSISVSVTIDPAKHTGFVGVRAFLQRGATAKWVVEGTPVVGSTDVPINTSADAYLLENDVLSLQAYSDTASSAISGYLSAVRLIMGAGEPGPPGPPGASIAQTYIFTQGSPSAIWNIAHNSGQWPSVTVVDTGNSEVIPDVHYVDSNNITLTFGSPTSGKAFLN